MQLTITSAFWGLFPDARIGLVIAHGIDNTRAVEQTAALLANQIAQSANALADVEIASHPMVVPWRTAYARFGAKPSKFRSSIESLLHSAQSGRLRSIEDSPPWPGEVIYADSAGAICRCFNWREADRTKLTETTTDAILVMETLTSSDHLQHATHELAALIEHHLGGTLRTTTLDREHPNATLA